MTTTAEEAIPRDGSLVEVRGQRWVVSDSSPGNDGSTLLTLQSVEDGRYGESLQVIWEVEPGRRALPAGSLPMSRQPALIRPNVSRRSWTRYAAQRSPRLT